MSHSKRVFPAIVLFLCLAIAGPLRAADSVALENTKAGTTTWQLTNPASMSGANSTRASDYAVAEIQGYASRTTKMM